MSKKHQAIPPPSTKEKLELLIERAEVLTRYFSENFSDADITKIATYRNTAIEGDEWKFHTLTYGLICLIRPFFLPSDGIALYPLQPDVRNQRKLQPTDVPLRNLSNEPNWHEAVDQAIEKINELFYGIGALLDAEQQSDYEYNGKPVTRLAAFSTIIYGEIIHFNIEKRRAYMQWRKAPGDLFSNILLDFVMTAHDISLRIIPPVAEASKRELQRLTS